MVSKNLLRRHLDASQRGMIAAELAVLESGQHPQATPNGGATISQAAQSLNVGERTVKRAMAVAGVVSLSDTPVTRALGDFLDGSWRARARIIDYDVHKPTSSPCSEHGTARATLRGS